MGLRPGIRRSHSEFAVTQLLVDLPAKFGHVLLGEAEWLRQGQVLAVLGVKKAGCENRPLSSPPSQDLGSVLPEARSSSVGLSKNFHVSQTRKA